MHGVGADEEEIRPGALNAACGIDQNPRGFIPPARILQSFDLGLVREALLERQLMRSAELLRHQLVNDTVVLDR